MNLGERVRELRTARGITLPKLAAEAGISKGYVWKIEQSGITRAVNVRPSNDTLTKLATALGVTVGDLVDEGQGSKAEVAGVYVFDAGPELPKSLVEYSTTKKRRGEPLRDDQVQMLCRITYDGLEPMNVRDWDYIFESIRRVLEQ